MTGTDVPGGMGKGGIAGGGEVVSACLLVIHMDEEMILGRTYGLHLRMSGAIASPSPSPSPSLPAHTPSFPLHDAAWTFSA